jgi:hypothetical protein
MTVIKALNISLAGNPSKLKCILPMRASIREESTDIIPKIPATPNPGITNISKTIKINPSTKSKTSQFCA